MPGHGIAEYHPARPGGAGEAEVAQRLDEGPLVADPHVQQFGRECPRSILGLGPEPLQGHPRLLEARDRGRVHLRAIGHPSVELGLHEGTDVDPVDRHALDLAGDLDIDQLEPGEAHVVEGDRAQVGVLEVRAPRK